MNNAVLAFTLSSLAGISTTAGFFIVFFSKKENKTLLVAGLAFAASVMFFLSILDLIPESIKFLTESYKIIPTFLTSLIGLSFGVCLSITIDKFFPNNFDNKELYKLGLITMIGIMIHNIPEGIATFITTNEDIKLGISITIAIAMHNIPEGISIALPIYYYTKSKRKAFLYTMICAISEPLGAVLAFLFFKATNMTLGIIYSIVAGIMIYISMYELLPASKQYKRYKITYLFYIFGFILVLINIFLF